MIKVTKADTDEIDMHISACKTSRNIWMCSRSQAYPLPSPKRQESMSKCRPFQCRSLVCARTPRQKKVRKACGQRLLNEVPSDRNESTLTGAQLQCSLCHGSPTQLMHTLPHLWRHVPPSARHAYIIINTNGRAVSSNCLHEHAMHHRM